MLEKFFPKKRSAEGQRQGSERQQSVDPGKPNYITLILGVMVMVVGIGFVGYMFMMDGGQQRVTVDRSAVQDQRQSKGKRLSSSDSGSSALSRLQKEGSGSENPLKSEGKARSGPGMDKATQGKSPQGTCAGKGCGSGNDTGLRETASGPGAVTDRAESEPGTHLGRQAEATSTNQSPQMSAGSEVTRKLDSLKPLVKSGFDGISSSISNVQSDLDSLRAKVERNGERLRKMARKAGNFTSAGVSAEKYASLKAEKAKLESRVSDLKDRVEELDGKYDWVRKLERKRRKKLKETKEKLARVKKKLKQRPVFADWAMVGLSEDEVVFKNRHDGTIRRLSEGDTFQGVEIEDVNFDKRLVRTDAGVVGDVK